MTPETPKPPRPNTQNQCSPAMKNSAIQTSETSMVWPKSGCSISGMIVAGHKRMAISVPGTSRRLPPSEKAQATRMTKAGFRNSDGWMPKIQRREPLTSWPNSSATRISPIETRKTMTAMRRTWRGVRKETAISTAIAGIRAIA